VVGFSFSDQHTPFEVIAVPPSEAIVPPEVEDVKLISVISAVAMDGATRAVVVTEISLP
jgi:hypothetical protein